MTPPKHPKSRLQEALRANLRRRKAQMQARQADSETDETGVRYSGFARRDGQRPEDGTQDSTE